MDIIRHRINEKEQVERLLPGLGAEIDIRSRDGDLILAHDPHQPGLPLTTFLQLFAPQHKNDWLILNPKEDGLETAILAQLQAHHVTRFFFLDLTLPTLVRLALREGEKRLAVRASEFEPLEMAERFAGKVDWVWVDCFDGRPPAQDLLNRLKRNFKICLVSPELQSFEATRIVDFRPLAASVDAVCTKYPDQWR